MTSAIDQKQSSSEKSPIGIISESSTITENTQKDIGNTRIPKFKVNENDADTDTELNISIKPIQKTEANHSQCEHVNIRSPLSVDSTKISKITGDQFLNEIFEKTTLDNKSLANDTENIVNSETNLGISTTTAKTTISWTTSTILEAITSSSLTDSNYEPKLNISCSLFVF